MLLIAFIGSCFLLAMIPGVSTAVILRQTLRAGRGPGMAATLGNETGILLWALAAAFGLSALVLASEVAYDVMRIVGAVFLIVMGAQSIWQARGGSRAAEPREEPVGEVARGWRRSYLLGFSTCLANPKAAVFAMSFLPQFVPEGANVPLTLIALAVIWVLVDTVWYGLFIWMVGRARLVFGRPAVRRRLERISGAVLIGLGVRLAVESR
ncbi:lysine transporter LysE [Planobispora rosea]|uniref:Lysine transporter LysE n=1 Tax=Planobispora rosea TaxID=35762 RepID=A0A8J3S9E1_PLARO|nr:LysE family translocator [Planobispora rosea]GGT02223.1 lysine transporter LysE [Planobispora rosea]GIH88446.1 lysine transporter LysE [Planobispora rosea]